MFPNTARRLTNPIRMPAPRLRRLLFVLLTLATCSFGVTTMFHVLNANGMSILEGVILALFAITFTWITIAFWTGVAGFALQVLRRDPLSFRRQIPRGDAATPILARTAVVMPVHNEDPERVVAGLEATCLDLMATGEGERYDFFLLSDTTRHRVAVAEERAISALCQRLGSGSRVFYRRRASNAGRKAGNIADFCRNWGAHYDYMVVLDADSVMSGQVLLKLTRAMQANPAAGIIQTVPLPARQETVFGRFMQFAASLYSPMLATGMVFWQCETASYWGHNAIIRVQAFMDWCGLPELSGEPPLGGEILSHDFVEAALMRRAGYHVYVFAELEGSYEETPGNLLDHVRRDRRWAEGNLQHIRLVTARGLHPLSRLYFVLGALAYVSSLLWLGLLVAGTGDAIGKALRSNDLFLHTYQLFPDWPVSRPEEMLTLLGMVVTMLFLPKLMAVGVAMLHQERRAAFGGGLSLLAGAAIEILYAVLIAPVMMAYHACFVTGIVLGGRTTWSPQSRDGRYVALPDALRSTAAMTLAGLVWALGTAWVAPVFALALTPVLAGLLLSAPLITLTSSARLGAWLRDKRLLVSPTETYPAPVLRTLERLTRAPAATPAAPVTVRLPPLPRVRNRGMPKQVIARQPMSSGNA